MRREVCSGCDQCEEIYCAGLCERCHIAAAEGANEALHDGPPPVSLTEQSRMADEHRRARRGY